MRRHGAAFRGKVCFLKPGLSSVGLQSGRAAYAPEFFRPWPSVKMDLQSDSRPDAVSTSAVPAESSAFSDEHDAYTLRALADRLSHHLLGLVNSIEGYTDMLADTLGTEEQRELSFRILEGTARIERIVHDLRRFSEPIEPVIRAVMARQLIDGVRELIGPERWLRVEVDWSVEERPHELIADPVLLRQALFLLVQNALEATPERSVRLVVEADTESEQTRFAVWNEGKIGLDRPRQRIFEPFFSTKSPNLGIGLPLARRIVEAHDGELQLVSTEAEAGTWFAVVLPRPRDVTPDDLVLKRRR